MINGTNILLSLKEILAFFVGFFIAGLLAVVLRQKFIRDITNSLTPSEPKVAQPLKEAVERVQDTRTIGLADNHYPPTFIVLMFGPALICGGSTKDSTTDMIAHKRTDLRAALEKLDFNVLDGEDLQRLGENQKADDLTTELKERHVARKAHAILVLATSNGSAMEVGIFSQDPALCRKMVIAIHQDHAGGFLAQGAALEAAALGAQIITYSHDDLASCKIQTNLIREALRLYQGLLSRRFIMRPNF